MDILHLIRVSAKAGADEALIATGNLNPMVSKREAVKRYGTWFTESCKAGRLHPCMVGNGRTATHWYSVREIDALMIQDAAPAEILWK